MKIQDLDPDDADAIEQVAALLVDFSPNRAAAWPDVETAIGTVEETLDEDSLARVAVNDAGVVVGFAAAAPQYSAAWELHPIVVARDEQGRGVGRALVEDIEELVANEGGLTMYLGADDLDESTSLADEELFPGVLEAASELELRKRRHPIGFFRHLGYEVVGVIPDANGAGQPDVWLARSVADLADEEANEPPEIPED
jgi:aminoglycoside 6'-N-acetyltransferase I